MMETIYLIVGVLTALGIVGFGITESAREYQKGDAGFCPWFPAVWSCLVGVLTTFVWPLVWLMIAVVLTARHLGRQT